MMGKWINDDKVQGKNKYKNYLFKNISKNLAELMMSIIIIKLN